MKISDNTTVQIDFSITDTDGNIIESTQESGPILYIHGKEMMLQAVEDALLGKEAGDSITVSLTPEEAFGVRDDSLVQEFPIDAFEGFENLAVGNEFQTFDDDDEPVIVTVTAIENDTVTVDGNHPFADMDLTFKVDVREIRETTEEDIHNLLEHEHGEGCCGDSMDDPDCDHNGGCGCCKHE